MRALWVAVVLVTNVITAAVLLGWHWYDDRHGFDIAKWRTSSPGDCNDDYRQRMVRDLSESYLRAGMTPATVRWLLGSPEYETATSEGGKQWVYDTGMNFSNCDSLVVRFSRDGQQVSEWRHRLLDSD